MRFIKQFHIQILFRLIGILVAAVAATYLWIDKLYFTSIGIIVIALVFIWSLINYINDINDEVKIFLHAVKNRDNGVFFNPAKYGKPFSTLFDSFNEILSIHRTITIEKEAVFQLMNSTLEKAPFGIIVIPKAALFDDTEKYPLQFINNAVENILQIPRYKYWHRIKEHDPAFAEQVATLANGGKKFVEYNREGLTLLSLETQVIYSREEPLLIISFQNVKSEVEQKEMEAWSKLINVLTHEILNSITPIHSMTYSIKNILDQKGKEIDDESLEDLQLAINTIQKRTNGLMSFVSDYRHVAELPTPVLKPIIVNDLLQRVKYLMEPLANKKSVSLQIDYIHPRYILNIDEHLMEQVLINLVTNSIYACEDRPNSLITVSFHNNEGAYSIKVSDNGKGIPKENIDKIFVPFFTTRSNGSGIGLTITGNIMKLHSGNIEVDSMENIGTTFALRFPKDQGEPIL